MIEDLDARPRVREPVSGDETRGSGADDGAKGSGDGRVLPRKAQATQVPHLYPLPQAGRGNLRAPDPLALLPRRETQERDAPVRAGKTCL